MDSKKNNFFNSEANRIIKESINARKQHARISQEIEARKKEMLNRAKKRNLIQNK